MTNKLFYQLKLLSLGIGAFVLIAIAAIYSSVLPTLSACNPPLPTENISIGTNIFIVELATTDTEQTCGLSGRTNLQQNQGMLFPFTTPSIQSFWMKDMKFSLDMIWIGNGKVLGFTKNAAPQPGAATQDLKIYSSPDSTDTVLEVNAGTVVQDNITVGDPVTTF